MAPVPLAVTCEYSAKHKLRAATSSNTPGAGLEIACLLLLFLLALLGDFTKAAN